MFRLTSRLISRVAQTSIRSQLVKPMAFRFYSSNGLSTTEIIRRISESNSHLIKSPTELTNETKLAQDLGLDSLDSTEFLVNVENEFDLQLSDEESEKVKTIGQIVEIISSNPQAS
ncbi:hypothetical protein WICMUC_004234 [Wickerhamomyces mucosus]|uniref:Acyl carrier protein n=1 Tax=Wickerhamomyces mucosus TaxID=1378264 RepID=A0A9P8PHL3_9ASCO|nr:hypothetical protein WICMUC_004234 [Wickerhamomyces mucosus]